MAKGKIKQRLTQRAPDWWESARFQAVCVAWSGFRQNGVILSRPPAGNARRWASLFRRLIIRRMNLNLWIALLFSSIWIGLVSFLRLKKKKSLAFLLFFTIFYVYLAKVLDYTLFQFQSLVLLRYFMPDLILNGQTAEKSMNLIPLITLTPQDLETSLLNILLLIPLGVGLPFITNYRMTQIVITGVLFSFMIEFLQLVTGFVAKIYFRIADINDVIFNTVGAAIGYLVFVVFVRIYRHISHTWKVSANPISRYIAERPQID